MNTTHKAVQSSVCWVRNIRDVVVELDRRNVPNFLTLTGDVYSERMVCYELLPVLFPDPSITILM
jgi:hypothetical protein